MYSIPSSPKSAFSVSQTISDESGQVTYILQSYSKDLRKNIYFFSQFQFYMPYYY